MGMNFTGNGTKAPALGAGAFLLAAALAAAGCDIFGGPAWRKEGGLILRGYGKNWYYTDGVFTIVTGEAVEVTGSTSTSRVVVEMNANVAVTLKNANIRLSAAAAPFELSNGAGVFLTLVGDNSLVSAYEGDGAGFAGLRVWGNSESSAESVSGESEEPGESTSVSIEGPGSLYAQGSGGGAGIGGSRGEDGGYITIRGGAVTAVGGAIAAGGQGGAGIGGGQGGSGGFVSITGGRVDARGAPSAAGIGGGAAGRDGSDSYGGSGGSITISGGSGTATAANGGGYGTGRAVGPGAGGTGYASGAFNGEADWPLNFEDSEGGAVYEWDGQTGSVVVFFNANSGILPPPPRGGLPGVLITLPAFEGEGGFQGWYTAENDRLGGGGDLYIVPDAYPDPSVTLYALWQGTPAGGTWK